MVIMLRGVMNLFQTTQLFKPYPMKNFLIWCLIHIDYFFFCTFKCSASVFMYKKNFLEKKRNEPDLKKIQSFLNFIFFEKRFFFFVCFHFLLLFSLVLFCYLDGAVCDMSCTRFKRPQKNWLFWTLWSRAWKSGLD